MFTLTRAMITFSAFWFQQPTPGVPTPAPVEPTSATVVATAGAAATESATAAATATANAAAAASGKGLLSPDIFPLVLGVVTGIVLLLILILLAARIFGRGSGRHSRAARAGAAAAGAATGARQAPPPAEGASGGRSTGAVQAGAGQAGARWLIRPDGQKVLLNKLPLSIGRDKSNQLVIDHPSLADRHARIYLDETENVLCIEDASDGNSAVLVNGSPTRKNILSDNDRISLGDVTLQYHEAAPGQNAAAQG